jgi:hypothetical protein
MMLVKLTDQDFINPEDVTNVYVREYNEYTFVRMRDGTEYSIHPPYGMMKYENLDRIIKLINGNE